MASVSTVSIKFTGDAKQLEDTFTKVGVKANLMASGIEAAFRTGAGFAKDFISQAINVASTTETTLIAFENLLGSAKEAKSFYADLLDFAARTPFNTQQINSGATTLLGFGLSARDAAQAIKDLGAAAAANADTDLKRLVVTFGQIQGNNKAMLEDLKEFVNNGIPIFQILADELGVSTAEISRMASASEITGDVISKVFREAAQEGGRFANTLETQSQTLAGLTSTLQDNYAIAIGKLGEKLLPAAKEAVMALNSAFDDLDKYLNTDGFNKFTAGLITGVKSVGLLAETVRNAIGPVVGLYNAALSVAQVYRGDFADAWQSAKKAGEEFVRPLQNILNLTENAGEVTDTYVQELRKLRAAQRDLGFLTPDAPGKPKTPIGPGVDPKAAAAAQKARDDAFKAELDYLVRLRAMNEDADKEFDDRQEARLRKEEEALKERNKLLEQYGKEAAAIQKALDAEIDAEIDARNAKGQAVVDASEDQEQADRAEKLVKLKEAEAKALSIATQAVGVYKSALAAAHAEGITGSRAQAKAVVESAKQVIGALIREGVTAHITGILKSPAGQVPFLGLALAAAGGIAAEALFRALLSSIKIPAFGDGGIVYGPTLALIGEKGPEAIVPLNGRSGKNTMDVNIRGVEYGGDRYWMNEQASILGRLTNG